MGTDTARADCSNWQASATRSGSPPPCRASIEGRRGVRQRALLPLLRTELNRLRRRLVLILELIRDLEAERAAALAAAAIDAMVGKIIALQRIRGIGSNFAAVLVREVLYRSFA